MRVRARGERKGGYQQAPKFAPHNLQVPVRPSNQGDSRRVLIGSRRTWGKATRPQGVVPVHYDADRLSGRTGRLARHSATSATLDMVLRPIETPYRGALHRDKDFNPSSRGSADRPRAGNPSVAVRRWECSRRRIPGRGLRSWPTSAGGTRYCGCIPASRNRRAADSKIRRSSRAIPPGCDMRVEIVPSSKLCRPRTGRGTGAARATSRRGRPKRFRG